MGEVQWYYARNEQQYGPVSAAELRQLADAGRLTPDDLLWREGMDAWTTAINLRGLFEPALAKSQGADELNGTPAILRPAAPAPRAAAAPQSLRALLRVTQMMLWSLCVLVVLVGLILFTVAFLRTKDSAELTATGAIYSTFFVAAYALARAGEKLSRLLLQGARRRMQ